MRFSTIIMIFYFLQYSYWYCLYLFQESCHALVLLINITGSQFLVDINGHKVQVAELSQAISIIVSKLQNSNQKSLALQFTLFVSIGYLPNSVELPIYGYCFLLVLPMITECHLLK